MNVRKFIDNRHILLLLALLISLFVRIPFMLNDISFNNDASSYSENFEKKFFDGTYNVHPPGYISYIYTGRIINDIVKNTVVTQHVINIILIVLIVILFFYLLELFGLKPLDCFVITLFFSLNNVMLLGSITGGNRMFLVLSSVVLMIISYKIIREDRKNLIILFAFFYAFFTGFRQDIAAYYILLYLYLLFKVKDIKLILLSLLVFTVINLMWFIPSILEYGGLVSYFKMIETYKTTTHTSLIASGFKLSPLLNIVRVLLYSFFSLIVILPVFIYTVIKKKLKIEKDIFVILFLTFIAAFLSQLLYHNGNYEHIACFLTPLFIFLLFNFKTDSVLKYAMTAGICIILFFQFYGLKMFNDDIPGRIRKSEMDHVIISKIKKKKDKDFLLKEYKINDGYYVCDFDKLSKKEEKRLKNTFYTANYKFPERIINVVFLQFTFDGVKKGKTYRLRGLKEEYREDEDD